MDYIGRTKTIILIFVLLFFHAAMTMAKPADYCETAFIKIVEEGSNEDIAGKTTKLELLSSHCMGTGIYEARLAKLYSLAGRNSDSERLLENAIKQGLPYDKELRFTLFSTLFAQKKPDEAKEIALAIIRDYPTWDGGYLSMGQVSLLENDVYGGIEYLEQSLSFGETVNAYLLLTMAYYEVKKYRESAISMQEALKRDTDSILHTQAVCAASYSLTALGYHSEAKELLTRHLKLQPKAKNDPAFQQAITKII